MGVVLASHGYREEAHRCLMRCYYCQGQRCLALRQYHLCIKCLREELDVSPANATTVPYLQIRSGKPDQPQLNKTAA